MLIEQNTDTQVLLYALGKHIRKLRMGKNITQTELAMECDMDKASLSKIESGQVNISFHTLYRLSIGLKVSIKDLIP